MRHFTAAVMSLALLSQSCQSGSPCDEVTGGCLLLQVEGAGSFEKLVFTAFGPQSVNLKSGDLPMEVSLPYRTRMTAPPGVNTTAITAIRIDGIRQGQIAASGTTDRAFSWPDRAHVNASVSLGPSPPGPLLVWREENGPMTTTGQLYDVWIDTPGMPAIAVGENGSALARSVTGEWTAETTGAGASQLSGVDAFAGGTGWAAGQSPSGIWRRSGTSMQWSRDDTGVATSVGFWCLATGQAAGEVWAGSDVDGKVWHRTGPTTGAGTWVGEQALPNGVGVYGIAAAGGVVFAVGDYGNVAVRATSGVWTRAKISGNFAASDWLNAVWAIDANNAVAVGTGGTLITYQNGQWTLTAMKIDSENGELTSVWATSASKIWITSKNGYILRVDGNTTYKLYEKSGVALNAIHGLSESNIYAVGGTSGQPGLIVHGTP